MPSGTGVRVAIFVAQHIEIRRSRDDFVCLMAYLTERRLLFSLTHTFSSLTGRRAWEDFVWPEAYLQALEAHSGQMPPLRNRDVQLASRLQKIAWAGSDSHLLPSLGSAYTEVLAARYKGVRRRTDGQSGAFSRHERRVSSHHRQIVSRAPWTLLLNPRALLLPLATLATSLDEALFAPRWSARGNGSRVRLRKRGSRS